MSTYFNMQIIKGQKFPKPTLVPFQNQTGSNQDFEILQFGVKYQVLFFQSGFRFIQTEPTVNRKISEFRASP